MAEFKLGEKVRGTGSQTGARYEGVVIQISGIYGPKIQITKNHDYPSKGAQVGRSANIKNVERIEDMPYTKNLIGPKPEPVQTPKFVAPFRADASSVVDANGRVVIKVRQGGHMSGGFALDLSMSERYDLAKVIAEALTEKFATTVKDAPSPF